MTSWDVVFVTGDRHWSDHVALQEALQHHAPGTWLVEGGAPGADHVAKVVGMALGFHPIEVCALWNRYGKKAGPIRNLEMLHLLLILRKAGHPITCYACHNDLERSKGTKHMTGLLTASGLQWSLVTSSEVPA
jgi:hypothetical protein